MIVQLLFITYVYIHWPGNACGEVCTVMVPVVRCVYRVVRSVCTVMVPVVRSVCTVMMPVVRSVYTVMIHIHTHTHTHTHTHIHTYSQTHIYYGGLPIEMCLDVPKMEYTTTGTSDVYNPYTGSSVVSKP